MWHPGLVLRRMAAGRALVPAACATALFATTVLAALVGYAGEVTREGLRRTLAAASFEQLGTRVAAPVPPGGLDAATRRVDGALRRIYRDVPLSVSVGVRSDSYTLPGQERSDHPELTAFATYSGIERHARLAAGRWPAATAPSGGPVEAVLPVQAARSLRVAVGDELTVRGRIDKAAVARARVVGTFAPRREDDYFWQGDKLVTTGVERLDYTTYGPLVVQPGVFASRFTGTGAEVRWTVLPDLSGVEPGGLAALNDRVRAGPDTFQRAGEGTRFSVVTELPELISQIDDAVLVARSTMLMPVLQLVLLAGYAWVLVARLFADHRRTEVALLRTRGAGLRQLAALGLAEGLLIVLPAALLGPFLAGPLLQVAGFAPAVRSSGLGLDPGPLAPLFAVSAATALACAVVAVVPTLLGANRTFVEAQAGLGRTRRGALRGSGADLALLAVAALGIWQLTRYGGATGAGGGAERGGIDPFIVSGPALALLAGGVLLLRLVPVASHAAERAAARGRGLAPVLGARQVSRRHLRHAGPALLLVMAMAVGVLSVTTMATWRRSQADQADFQAGADLRLAAPDDARGPGPLGRGGRFGTLPGVTASTAVLRKDAMVGTTPATMLAADASALGPLLRVRPGLRRGLRLGALAAARPRAPLVPVPGRPEAVEFDVRLAPAHGGPAPKGPYRLGVVLADGRGVTHRADLPDLAADGGRRTVALTAADLAGPGGAVSYPLSIRGFRYAYDDNPEAGALRLDVLRIAGRGGGSGGAALPPKSGWDVFGEVQGRASAVPDGLREGAGPLSIAIPAAPPKAAYEIVTGRSVHALLTGPGGTGRGGGADGGSRRQPAVPGVVTAALAGTAKLSVGSTVTLDTVDGAQPVKVAGIVRALPSLPPDRPGVLVDLPTAAELRTANGTAGPESVRPGEWWASARGGRTGPAARAMAAHRDWGEVAADRAALRDRLRDAPLGAALQGALMLGFAAALAFAVIAFVVNAAVAVRERAREFAVLRTLGVRTRQLAGMLAVEQAFLVALGIAGGLALGLVVARLVVPDTVLSVQAAPPYPPADLVVRWPVVAAMAAGVAAVLGLVLALVIRTLRRRGLAADLRAGEDG